MWEYKFVEYPELYHYGIKGMKWDKHLKQTLADYGEALSSKDELSAYNKSANKAYDAGMNAYNKKEIYKKASKNVDKSEKAYKEARTVTGKTNAIHKALSKGMKGTPRELINATSSKDEQKKYHSDVTKYQKAKSSYKTAEKASKKAYATSDKKYKEYTEAKTLKGKAKAVKAVYQKHHPKAAKGKNKITNVLNKSRGGK